MADAAWSQTNAADLYRQAMRREATLRKEIDGRKGDAPSDPLLERARTLAQTYEDIARLFPRSGYSDNALWQSAALAADAFWEFGQAADRARALRIFRALEARYPTSSLLKQVHPQTARLEAAETTGVDQPVRPAPPAPAARVAPLAPPAPSAARTAPSALRAIHREVLPDALRVTLELDREVPFYDERIEGPPRVFVDLQNTRPLETLKDAALSFPEDVVGQIRVGRQQDGHTRVVLDIRDAARHSVYPLYNPYRIVLDFERIAPTSSKIAPPSSKIAPASSTIAQATARWSRHRRRMAPAAFRSRVSWGLASGAS
jgi:N-acetylmuramoyl-L-alanine amidase